jgi:hypothetical protein
MLPQTNNPLAAPIAVDNAALEEVGDWDDDELDLDGNAAKKPSPTKAAALEGGDDEEGEGWGDDDLDLDEDEFAPAETGAAAVQFVPPSPGPNVADIWVRSSQLAADHIAAGSFESAMQVRIPSKRKSITCVSYTILLFVLALEPPSWYRQLCPSEAILFGNFPIVKSIFGLQLIVTATCCSHSEERNWTR